MRPDRLSLSTSLDDDHKKPHAFPGLWHGFPGLRGQDLFHDSNREMMNLSSIEMKEQVIPVLVPHMCPRTVEVALCSSDMRYDRRTEDLSQRYVHAERRRCLWPPRRSIARSLAAYLQASGGRRRKKPSPSLPPSCACIWQEFYNGAV